MLMRRLSVILPLLPASFLVNAAFAAEATSHMADLRTVRSLAAEAALALTLQEAHRSMSVYTRAMKDNARRQLQDIDDSSGADDAALRSAIDEAIAAIENDDAAALHAIADRLFALAGPRGPAR
jgi:hypothetical protein